MNIAARFRALTMTADGVGIRRAQVAHQAIRRVARGLVALGLGVTMAVSSALAQTGGYLSDQQVEALSADKELSKFFNDLSFQYPEAAETLVLQAAEELLYGGVVVVNTRRALEASKRPLALNDTLTVVPAEKTGVADRTAIMGTGSTVGVELPSGVTLPSGGVTLEDLGVSAPAELYPYVILPSQDGDGDGFVLYNFNNGIAIAVNGDGVQRVGFLNIVIPWPWD